MEGIELLKRCDVAECFYTQVFRSGMGFSENQWVHCKTCGDHVVDEGKKKND